MQTPPSNNQKQNKKQLPIRWPGMTYWIVLFTTILLLITLTISFFVVLAMTENSGPVDYSGGGNKGNNSGGGGTSAPTKGQSGISLPCSTPGGSYLSSPASGVAQIEGISSASAILVDIDNKLSLAEKSADVKIYPASMTKIMTLLVACEHAKNPSALLTVTAEMVEKYESPENDGASVAFEWEEGNQVTVEDALHMVIYKSDTYACWLLADYVTNGAGEAAFVTMMNNKARSLGLNSTNFTNCTGLHNENHYTTCRDMAAIMASVMKNETATQIITKTSKYVVKLYANGSTTNSVDIWCNWYTNRLEAYRWGAAAPYYAGNGSDIKIVAGKTGYETIPTNCFVTSGVDTETGKRYVCVQVGRIDDTQPSVDSKTSTDDTRIIYQKYAK